MKRPRQEPPTVICGNCLRTAAATYTQHGWRWDCWHCRTRTWDPNYPMVGRDTLRARQRAHAALDSLWKSNSGMTEAQVSRLLARSKVYTLLAEEMGLPEKEVHISNATEEVALAIPRAVENLRDRLNQRSLEQIREDYRERGKEMFKARSRASDNDNGE